MGEKSLPSHNVMKVSLIKIIPSLCVIEIVKNVLENFLNCFLKDNLNSSLVLKEFWFYLLIIIKSLLHLLWKITLCAVFYSYFMYCWALKINLCLKSLHNFSDANRQKYLSFRKYLSVTGIRNHFQDLF